MSLSEPNFIDRDPDAITREMIAAYEAATGKTLYPAQVDRIQLDLIAYRETNVRIAIQEAAKQNLVRFARGAVLDELGRQFGAPRLAAQSARTVLRFSAAAALPAVVDIPAGTRVSTSDGAVVFVTDTAAELAIGALSVDVSATAEVPGTGGNAWAAGQIARAIDPLGNVLAVQNIDTTHDGADEEADDALRERIPLAWERFSTAGSVESYRFHALSVSPLIVDVEVLSPSPCVIEIYPLTSSGLPSQDLLDAVLASVSAAKVRPLTDKVSALAPAPVDYAIEATLIVEASADQATVLALANAAADAYKAARAAKLAGAVVPSQIVAALSMPGVFDVTLLQPAAKLTLASNEWPNCTGIALAIAGVANG